MTSTASARIRPPESADYPALANIHNGQNEPDHHTTPERLRAQDDRSSAVDAKFRRMVVELDGEVVATGTVSSDRGAQTRNDRRWVWLHTAEGRRGLGLDVAMLQHALENDCAPVSEVCSCIRSDFLPLAEYIEAEGFQELYRSWGSHLDLRRFNPSRFEGQRSRLAQEGVRLVPYQDLQDTLRRPAPPPGRATDLATARQLEERVIRLQRELEEDAEHFEPIIPKRHDDLRSEDARPDTWILAVSGRSGKEQLVGLASLEGSPDGGTTHLGFVGVIPAFRNRGVGTALTASVAAIARRQGLIDLNAGGGGMDTPMLSLLRALGFDTEPAWVTLALAVNQHPK